VLKRKVDLIKSKGNSEQKPAGARYKIKEFKNRKGVIEKRKTTEKKGKGRGPRKQ
jgi:hypothetical protein